jgi:hypothetical protein
MRRDRGAGLTATGARTTHTDHGPRGHGARYAGGGGGITGRETRDLVSGALAATAVRVNTGACNPRRAGLEAGKWGRAGAG